MLSFAIHPSRTSVWHPSRAGGQSPPVGNTVRVMTYNAELLHDTHTQAYTCKTQASRQELARVIAKADADVVLLQEVESQEALDEFMSEHLNPVLRSQHKPTYQALTYETYDRGEVKNGIDFIQPILYRGPLTLVRSQPADRQAYAGSSPSEPLMRREVNFAEFSVDKGGHDPLTLLVGNLHLRCNVVPGVGSPALQEFISASMRLREAYAVQHALSDRVSEIKARTGKMPQVIVGGDFNTCYSMRSGPPVLAAMKARPFRPHAPMYNVETDQVLPVRRAVSFQRFRLHDGRPPVPLQELTPRRLTMMNRYYQRPYPDRQFDFLLGNRVPSVRFQPVDTNHLFRELTPTLRMASDHNPLLVDMTVAGKRC